MEWQPIETVPREEGRKILVWFAEWQTPDVAEIRITKSYNMEIVEFVDQWNNELYENGHGLVWPTHWQPIPKAPVT